MVLIPKGGGDYRSIGLMEVIWKAVAVIINRCFTAAITYHNFLHGFRAGHRTGTITLDLNLLQYLAALREAFLHEIFLDLHKNFNSLDRSSCMGILECYGVGSMDLCLL